MSTSSATAVSNQIRQGNPWYVGSQFEWAEKPFIRPIFTKRLQYFTGCIERTRARLGRPLRVLDAGCGDGYWLSRLAAIPDLALTGVDYNPLRVERATQAVPSAHIYACNLVELSTKERFDVILLNQVIEHVPDDVSLLNLVKSLLTRDGVVIVGTPNEGSKLQQWMLRRTGALKTTDHLHFYTEREISSKISQTGLTIESVFREVFYPGHEGLYYWLTARRVGFNFLTLLTKVWPAECSDYYFECRLQATTQ